MSQAAAQQPSRKKTAISLLVLLALTCIIVFTFKDHWAEITAALAQLSVWQVLAVLAVGISYPLLEGCVAVSYTHLWPPYHRAGRTRSAAPQRPCRNAGCSTVPECW